MLIVLLVPALPVKAASFDLKNINSCLAMGGGSLDPSFCFVSSLTIYPGETGTIESNMSLTIDNGGAVTNYGSLINKGFIINHGTLSNNGTVSNTGTIYNWGTLRNNQSSGIVKNQAAIYNQGLIRNRGSLNNKGVMANDCGGALKGNSVTGNSVQSLACVPVINDYEAFVITRTPTISGTDDVGLPLTITLYNGTAKIGATLDSSGSWSLTTVPLVGGIYKIVAVATNSSGGMSPPSFPLLLIIMPETTTTVKCVPSTLLSGTSTTCTATVTDVGGGTPTTPLGRVKFESRLLPGTFTSKYCTLSGSNGQASCSATFTPSSTGKYKIIAIYFPSDDHARSTGFTHLHVS